MKFLTLKPSVLLVLIAFGPKYSIYDLSLKYRRMSSSLNVRGLVSHTHIARLELIMLCDMKYLTISKYRSTKYKRKFYTNVKDKNSEYTN